MPSSAFQKVPTAISAFEVKTLLQRLNADKPGGRRYGEDVRAILPQSTRWKNLYGNRSLAESFNSWFKAKLLPNQRACGLGRLRQEEAQQVIVRWFPT